MEPLRLRIELAREDSAAGEARAAFDRLRPELREGPFQDARLLLSELVTNAVKYGGDGPLRVDVHERDDHLHVEVIDRGAGFEAKRTERARDREDLEAVGGWGLPLVETLAEDWGSFEGSTHVWFTVGV